jgi:phosphatidate cytidylyltransferase
MLKTRLVTALWGIPLVVLAVWFSMPEYPLPAFTILAAVAGILGIIEFYRMVGIIEVLPLAVFGILLTLLFIIYPHFNFSVNVSALSLVLIIASIIMVFLRILLPRQERVFRLWTWTLTGVLYVGWLISYLVALRLDTGRDWIYLTLFVIFATDTAAYFVGRAIGKHKIAPSISPGKTWEGAVAGVIGAVIVCYLFTLKTPLQIPLNILQSVILGFAVSIFGQIGDLAESKLKRLTGVKDSGKIMPGHGGILDRLDSILFAGVVVYFYYIFFFL